MERRVKLLRDDDGQFVEIPSEFEFPGEDAIMRREGNKLIIEPKQSNLFLSFRKRWSRLMRNFKRSKTCLPILWISEPL